MAQVCKICSFSFSSFLFNCDYLCGIKIRILSETVNGSTCDYIVVGKTSLMYKVPSKGIVQTIPTAKFNLETSWLPGFIALNVWDIGGQNIESWSSHCVDVDGLIFVVDSADHTRMEQARKQLMSILNLDEMRHVPVVAIANKQDLPTARKPEVVADQLGLKSLEERKWAVQGAMQGVGLEEAFERISTFLKYY